MTVTEVPSSASDERVCQPGRETPLAAPPATAVTPALNRGMFRALNRWFTVPLLNAGLGAWIGTPIGGWMLLLRVRGRRSGLTRTVPLSYLIAEGSIWIAAGFGRRTDWFLNLVFEPRVEVVLPGRTVACRAEEVLDEQTRRRIMPRFTRATGAPAYLGGCDPFRSSDEEILAATAGVPLIRLQPLGEPIVAGPDDPGGLGWVWRQTVVALLTLGAIRIAVRVIRRR